MSPERKHIKNYGYYMRMIFGMRWIEEVKGRLFQRFGSIMWEIWRQEEGRFRFGLRPA